MSKRRRKGAGSVLAMQAAWFGLGFKLLETGTHAAGVIARRSAMLAAAALEPARLADPEFVRMVAEKAEATGEACLRAARHAGRAGRPADATALAVSGIALAEACLGPYHRRVRANARRLGRKR